MGDFDCDLSDLGALKYKFHLETAFFGAYQCPVPVLLFLFFLDDPVVTRKGCNGRGCVVSKVLMNSPPCNPRQEH